MEKKYRTEPDSESRLLRIIALKDFSNVKKGDRGGLIEKEENLSQEGDCWIYDGAQVYGNARVSGNAEVFAAAKVYDNACISGDAFVGGNAEVYERAKVFNSAYIHGNAIVCGDAQIYGYSEICESATVWNNAQVYGNANIREHAIVSGSARVCGFAMVCDEAEVSGDIKLWSTENSYVVTSIKNSRDYVIILSRKEFHIFSTEHLPAVPADHFSISGQNYIKNIQTIRQIYGEEI